MRKKFLRVLVHFWLAFLALQLHAGALQNKIALIPEVIARAGTNVSSVRGAESSNVNPAGLVLERNELFLSGGVNLNQEEFQPVLKGLKKTEASWNFPFLAAYSHGFSERVFLGLAFSQQKVFDVEFKTSSDENAYDFQMELTQFQLSPAIGIKLSSRWSLGAAWNISKGHHLLHSEEGPAPLRLMDEDWSFSRFVVGAIYQGDRFALGLRISTKQQFELRDKNENLDFETAHSLAFGFHYYFLDEWVLHADVEYHFNSEQHFRGVQQNWSDQKIARIAFSYEAVRSWSFHAGYSFYSQFADQNSVSEHFLIAGTHHQVGAGAEKRFQLTNGDQIRSSLGLSYTMGIGSGPRADDRSSSGLLILGLSYLRN